MRLRRIALVAAAALVPLVPAGSASGSGDHIICVGSPVGAACSETAVSLKAAIAIANGNGVNGTPDVIWLAAGTYTDGPYALGDTGGPVTLRGSGQGSTKIALVSDTTEQIYLQVHGATVEDLTIVMNATSSSGDTGLAATDSTVTSVTVTGAGTMHARGTDVNGSTLSGVTVQMPHALADANIAMYSDGSSTVTDSDLTGTYGYTLTWLGLPEPIPTATLSRVSITADYRGITLDDGHLVVDDTLIDLGSGSEAIGLEASNENVNENPRSIAANHVTIVGGGATSIGAKAWAINGTVQQSSSITLTNSVIAGPATSIDVRADNNSGVPASSATVVATYSDWATQHVDAGTHDSTATITGANNVHVEPGFLDAPDGDFRLAPTSPLIDKGAPGTGTPTLDLTKGARILDGNGDGTAVRDMGAYEAPKKVVAGGAPDTTAPNTTITSHPKKRTTKRRVTFAFSSSEAHSTFQCRLDKKAWGACTSPKRVRVAKGWHVFKVRAIDAAHNVDATPARFRFHRV